MCSQSVPQPWLPSFCAALLQKSVLLSSLSKGTHIYDRRFCEVTSRILLEKWHSKIITDFNTITVVLFRRIKSCPWKCWCNRSKLYREKADFCLLTKVMAGVLIIGIFSVFPPFSSFKKKKIKISGNNFKACSNYAFKLWIKAEAKTAKPLQDHAA